MGDHDPEWTVQHVESSDHVRHRVSDQTMTVFQALASVRRIALLRTLCSAEGAISVPTATRRVLERERALVPDGGPTPTADEVRVTLRHVHIEKLRTADLIAFDESDRSLRLTADPDLIHDALDAAVGLTAATER